MPTDVVTVSRKQTAFRTMLAGILLYTVVLGFFNDYTDILHTGTNRRQTGSGFQRFCDGCI